MKHHWLFFFFASFIMQVLPNKAQTIIKGSAPLLQNKPITWFRYADYLTEKEAILLQDTISSDGSFSFRLEEEKIASVFLRIENNNHVLYLEPNRQYEIAIADELGEILYYPNETDTTQVFYQIGVLNYEYNRFLAENYEKIIRKVAAPDARKFAQYLSEKFTACSDSFFIKTRDYKIAGLYLLTQATGMQKLFDKYLRQQKLDFYHPEMMYFVNHFYQGYIYKIQIRDKEKKVETILMNGGPYQEMIDFIKQDPLVERTELAEFLVLRSLYDMYYNSQLNKDITGSFLHEIIANTSTEPIKQIARNFLGNIMRISEGVAYFPFSGIDMMGNIKQSDAYLDKNLYLVFFDIQHPKSIAEIRALQNFYKNYKRYYNFLAICETCTYSEMKEFKDKYNIQFDLLKVGNNVTQLYEVIGFPSAFIILKNGYFASTSAALPTSTLDKELQSFISGKK